MVLDEVFMMQYTISQFTEFCLRITIACLCGVVFGIERSHRSKEVGVRTHLIVCATAALLMVVSKYGFSDIEVGLHGVRGADDARIAAQVVSGISFLCAGVIIKVGGNIRGLTTAAGLWMTAAVGLTIGAGLYFVGIFMVFIIMGFQYLFHHFTFGNYSWTYRNVMIKTVSAFPIEDEITSFLAEKGGQWELLKVLYEKDESTYYFHVRTKKIMGESLWQDFYQGHNEIVQLEYNVNFVN